MDTIISYLIILTIVVLIVLKIVEVVSKNDKSTKLVDIGPDCRHSEEYKCADEILRNIFFTNSHDTAEQTQHIGTFYALWEQVRKYYYKQYITNRIISVKAIDIKIETKHCSNSIFIVMYIPVPVPIHRITPRSDIFPEDDYCIGMILPGDDTASPKYVTLKKEKRKKIVSVWTDDTTYTKDSTRSNLQMKSFKKLLLNIGNADIHSWDKCSRTYKELIVQTNVDNRYNGRTNHYE